MITPIPGNDLRVGDVLLPQVGRRMVVERITLYTRPGYPFQPLLTAHGPTTFPDGHPSLPGWTEDYYGHDWVVVDR
jgi:hypothetical protein